MRFIKERHELIFRIQLYIYNGAFLRNQLTAQSFVVDIRPSSKYPSDERNKCFSFQIKTTLKATTLGFPMCSTYLLLWKNQKCSTCYPMILYKRYSTTDILLGIFKFFWISYFTKQLKTSDCKGFLFAQNVKLLLFSQGCARAIVSM